MRDSCDSESLTCYTESLVTARKPHRCCETGTVIAKGERHWVCTGLCDGRWATYRQSWAAYRLARALNYTEEGGLACWIPFEGLAEEAGYGHVSREEWDAVCRGEITRPAVGDEADVLARMGVPLPLVQWPGEEDDRG